MSNSNQEAPRLAQSQGPWTLPEWIEENVREVALDRLLYARRTSAWYRRKKRPLQWTSKSLRIGAITLFSCGSIAPLLAQAGVGVSAYLGYILLALGGSLLLADRVFGVSAGWARFVVAAMNIEAEAEIFRVKLISIARLEDISRDEEFAKLCLDLTAAVSSIVADETKTWVSDFDQGRDELTKLGKARVI